MTVPEKTILSLIRRAMQVRENAYAPYSRFLVGAALLAEDGCVYTGCNVECASYPMTQCAERTALCAAVSQGKRKFTAVAIAARRKTRLRPLRPVPPAGPAGRCCGSFAGMGTCFVFWQKEKGNIRPIGSANCCR